jgi:hypothetical protein
MDQKPACLPGSACPQRHEPRLDAGKLAVLEHVFSYHAPTAAQIASMQEVRAKAKELAIAIMVHAPASADRSAGIRKLREAVQVVNAAIVLDGVGL